MRDLCSVPVLFWSHCNKPSYGSVDTEDDLKWTFYPCPFLQVYLGAASTSAHAACIAAKIHIL